MKIKLNKKLRNLLLSLVILIFIYSRFDIIGLRTILGIALFLVLPVYLILDFFDLEDDEKLFFSFFIGLGIVPLLVWYVNRIIFSLRISLIVTFLLLTIAGVYLRYKKKKHKV